MPFGIPGVFSTMVRLGGVLKGVKHLAKHGPARTKMRTAEIRGVGPKGGKLRPREPGRDSISPLAPRKRSRRRKT